MSREAQRAAELADQEHCHQVELAERIWCAHYHNGQTLDDIAGRINMPVDRVRELRDLHGGGPA